MAVALIKLTMGTQILEFTPAQVAVIEYNSGENNIRIALVSGRTINFITPSPTDALAKLTLLETAMNSGTGIASINDLNTAATTTTTTAAPTTTLAPASTTAAPFAPS
jgi:hypothetical protein